MSAKTQPQVVRVAVTQAEPAWFDLEQAVAKTIKLINEAADNGAKLVAFPEVWIPGYCNWRWYVFSLCCHLNLDYHSSCENVWSCLF